jgi:hypothetical protein
VELRHPRLDGNKLSYDVTTQPADGVVFIDNFSEAWANNAFTPPG